MVKLEICLLVEVLKMGLTYSPQAGGTNNLGFLVTSRTSAKFPAAYLFSTNEVYSLKPRDTPTSIDMYKLVFF